MKSVLKDGSVCAALVLIAAGFASGAERGATPPGGYELIGIDLDGDLYRIDTETGEATLLHDLPEGTGGGPMAYEPDAARLGVILSTGEEPGELLVIDPVTGDIDRRNAIVGLPAGQQKTGGVGYLGDQGGLVITFGPTGTFLEDKLALVNLDAEVIMTSPDLGLGDNDGCFWDFLSARLIVHDYNAGDGLPRVAVVEDIFTSPAITELAAPPIDGTMGDSASHPETGRIFITRFVGASGELVELVGNSYVIVGPYNAPAQIAGIAFVPATSCPADVNGDGSVNLADLNLVLSNFGQATADGDVNGDISVDLYDLNAVLAAFGTDCD